MKYINRHNRKGNILTDNAGSFLLMLLVVVVGFYLIWAYLIHGPSPTNTCGSLTGSQGVCKISCDTNTEVEFENVGCSGKANKCCVLKDGDLRDVILPEVYGGTSEYNFEISGIRFGVDYATKMPGCSVEDGTADTDGVTLLCPPLKSYRIPIAIDVTNTGTISQNIDVSAVPVVVISGNADSVKPVGTYEGVAKPLSGMTETLTVDVTISSSDTREGNYITIYPYAKCETRKCKLTDEQRRGILSYDPNKAVIVKFVDIVT